MSQIKKTLQVICPVYNEEKMVELFYNHLNKVLSQLTNYETRILFVMDKSSDNTADVLQKLATNDKRVQVLMLSSRFGHQMSLVAGIDHSQADAVIMMDSDLQHPPELIPEMLRQYELGHEVVYTIRNEPKDNSTIKKICSKLFYKVMNRLSEVEISSGEADFRLISKRVAIIFQTSIRERNQFLRGLFAWMGFKKIGITYDANNREVGVSKYSWARMFRFAFSGIVSFSKKPLQYAIYLGLIFSLFGFFFTGVTILNYYINDQTPSGWSTLSILVCLFGGIQLFFMGVLGEYIGAIFDEVKGRPLYLVESKINVE